MIKEVCMNGLITDPEKFKNKELIKTLYLEHIEDVKKNVPVQQLLVMELGDGWEKLCSFLEKDVLNVPYPFTNSTQEFGKRFPANGCD